MAKVTVISSCSDFDAPVLGLTDSLPELVCFGLDNSPTPGPGTETSSLYLISHDGTSHGQFTIVVDDFATSAGSIPVVYVPNTGSLDDFMTLRSHRFYLPPGVHEIELYTGCDVAFNLNWFKLTRDLPRREPPGIEIEAEACESREGMTVYQRQDEGGGAWQYDYFLGDIEPGNWADYRVNMAYDGTYEVYLDVATPDTAVGQVEILVDGQEAWPDGAYVQIPADTSWYAFKHTSTTTIQVAKNFHTIRLVARSNPGKHFNINKFHLGRIPPQ